MLETAYTALLVFVFLAVAWFSAFVVWKLYKGQR